MVRVVFAPAIQRHIPQPERRCAGPTVRAALEEVFRDNAELRGFVLDDQGRLRKHVALFVDGRHVVDRGGLGDAVDDDSEIYVVQALSGG